MSTRASSLALAALLAGRALAAPEDPGPLPIEEWDAGWVELGPTRARAVVIYPRAVRAALPVVEVVHGFWATGEYERVLAETLASRGFVVLMPDLPCGSHGCDHSARADAAIALVDWAVERSADPSSPIAGLVDGERRGLVGSSWGGLAVFIAAARDARIDAVVGNDPVEHDGAFVAEAARMIAPSLHIMSSDRGQCGSSPDWAAAAFPVSPRPRASVRVVGASHCDIGDPMDSFCALACRVTPDVRTRPVFRRYTVAWTACLVGRQPSMTSYVKGAALREDLAAGVLTDAQTDDLAALDCGSEAQIGEGDAPGGCGCFSARSDALWPLILLLTAIRIGARRTGPARRSRPRPRRP